jgi:formate dehydrogenase major subunit
MAECHPVGFRWVMEAKARGAKVIHVDPRFTRTSAVSDLHVPIRAGTDIAFLGGIVNHILSTGREFREYLVAYTNAPVIVRADFRDAEDLAGLFSGWDSDRGVYDPASWQYAGMDVPAASGERESARTAAEQHGALGAPLDHGDPEHVDLGLTHPRCVFQLLKRHYARYTPAMVAETCGVPEELFVQVAEALCANSGRERTSAFCYSVGWTQHTTGVQMIRTAAIIQLLLGNIGRPGGGILALRGHASIQGSTDIPTLFNLLPGYIPMPHSEAYANLTEFIGRNAAKSGAWGYMDAYLISLLKAWWGEHATADNDFCFDHLPRISGDHSALQTAMAMLDGDCRGYFLVGENPVVGTTNGRLHRKAFANLDWLVVRDLFEIESATFWKDGPDIEAGELTTEEIGTEVFLFPAASHVEKAGTFTNTQRLLQWREQAVEPSGDRRSDLWFFYHLGRRIRSKLAGSDDPRDRAVLELTWDYPVEGELQDPDAEAVLREINGWNADGEPLSTPNDLKADGSTACGCWIYCGCYASGVNQVARRKPAEEQDWVAAEWGWAWPLNRRVLYNRASADPDGRPWSERKRLVWWDEQAGRWAGYDVPDFPATKPPDAEPAEGGTGYDALGGRDAFIVQADGKGWLYAPSGLLDGPLPTHYEPHESPVANPLYRQQGNPARIRFDRPGNRTAPLPGAAGSGVYPYVLSTYRLTEHHTTGGMSRFVAPLAELQPEFFCEVSPELAELEGLEHGGWATIISARAAVEARLLVTSRLRPLEVGGRLVHQIGLPYHWGNRGIVTGDSANDLLGIEVDPNVFIHTTKASLAAVRAGRRPRGPALDRLVAEYRERAGLPADRDGGTAAGDERRGLRADRGHGRAGHGHEVPEAGRPVTTPAGPAPRRVGFFTDTSVCIGCKACEVACKEWNLVPPAGPLELTGHSYDNTGSLGADAWRHVAFIEADRPVQVPDLDLTGGDGPPVSLGQARAGMRWLMSSDVCKHCTSAACLDVCPTGALFRTEFGTVVVQPDVCNGCGYCIPACPFGVIDRREGDGRAWKCTLCYDRLKGGMEPACSTACPTGSIQFGPLDELRERARGRLDALHAAGTGEARLYLADEDNGVDGAGAFFLLLDEPEAYGLPPDPVDTTRDLGRFWRAAAVAAGALVAGIAAAFAGGRRRP